MYGCSHGGVAEKTVGYIRYLTVMQFADFPG